MGFVDIEENIKGSRPYSLTNYEPVIREPIEAIFSLNIAHVYTKLPAF